MTQPMLQPTFEPSERLVLLCLNQVSWRLVVDRHRIGLALAAVQIGTLMPGHLWLDEDGLIVVNRTASAPGSALLHQTWAAIGHETSPAPVRDWLTDLTEQGLFDQVIKQLTARDLLSPRRTLLGRVVYDPVDPHALWVPTSVLREGLRRRDRALPTGLDALVAACAHTIGAPVIDGPAATDRYQQALKGLPVVVHRLLAYLTAAVNAAAMT